MTLGRSLLAGIAILAGPVFAQGPKITLRVMAHDSHDQPVGDLTADDFQVSDQGKPQHITLLQHPENRQLDTPGARAESGAVPPHAVVLLFDLLNANLSYRGYGTDEVTKALQNTESDSHSIYLYLLTNSGALYPVHGLPGPDSTNANPNGPWTQQIKPQLEAAINKVFGLKPVDDRVASIRIDVTYRSLETLASQLAHLPGRKDVIWITHGVPITIRTISGEPYDYTPRLRQLASAIDRVGVTINTIDQGDAAASGSKETIEEFAAVTGGKAYSFGTLDKALPEVLNASRATYVIEYSGPPQDGKYHKLKVSTSRKGIRLQAEQGYFANR